MRNQGAQGRKPSGPRPIYINDKIKAFNIIVLGSDGEKIGLMPRAKALALAAEQGLDLVQMAYNPKDKVSTAKIVDFGKYMYEKKKKEKEKKKVQKQQSKGLKQVKISYSIGEHDLQMKLQKVKEALEKGYTVKILTQLRGREKAYKSVVMKRLRQMLEDFQSIARGQSPHPKEERNGYSIILVPLK